LVCYKKKHNSYERTCIIDETNIEYNIKLQDLNWLPNKNINKILNLISNNNDLNLDVIMNSSYHATRAYVSDNKDDTYIYPLIHSTPKTGIRYKYSTCNNKGHFGQSKIIFGEAGLNEVVIDFNGEYGMTQGAIAIKISNINEGQHIKKALLSVQFKEILDSCNWGNFRIDWRLFKFFKKDFWKEI
jgi:hypothetical protein